MEERKVFTHLVGERAPELNELLTHGGFRRSQSIAYRPACETCRACVSVRVLVDEFQPTRSMRRVRERNRDVIGDMRNVAPTSEQYSVFRAYLDARHHDGGMVDMTVLDYAMMVEDSHVNTRMIEYRRRGPDSAFTGRGSGELLAVALTDVLGDGLSMVYSFFEPAHNMRSLGTFMILDHIDAGAPHGPAACLSRLLGAGLAKDGLQGRFLPQERLTIDGVDARRRRRRELSHVARSAAFEIQRDNDRRNQRGEYGEPARRDQFAHLAAVCRKHHQRHDRERQLQAQNHLTEDQELCRAAFAVPDRYDCRRNDGDAARNQSARPRRQRGCREILPSRSDRPASPSPSSS